MPSGHQVISGYLRRLLSRFDVETMRQRLRPQFSPPPPKIPGAASVSDRALEGRWRLPGMTAAAKAVLLTDETEAAREQFVHNIEQFIGTVKVPVGLAGPLRVNGLFAQGDFYVPLATTEAALVASYSRGATLLTAAGGCTALLLNEGVTRAPGFAFPTLEEAGLFGAWASQQMDAFREVVSRHTRHGALENLRVTLEGNHVYLQFDFLTGDASGQNMVTIATQAICDHIAESSPIRPEYLFVESNFSGDKKASAMSFLSVRGKKVTAEALIPSTLLERTLHTTARAMVNYWRMAAVGGVMSGTMGIHGHYANGLAALYLACGQDVACVAESAVGVTRFEEREDGALYACVTLPNLIVGTVGGGTGLPSQKACLEILGLAGAGNAQALAEVAAALCLGGELSIIGALAANQFSRAHQKRARGARVAPGVAGGEPETHL